jgi:2-dehydropantoate 2-reductase
MPLPLLVVGAGPLGTLLAQKLAANGHNVTLYGRTLYQHMDNVKTTTDLFAVRPGRIHSAIFCVKSFQLRSAAAALAMHPQIMPERLISLANGVGGAEQLRLGYRSGSGGDDAATGAPVVVPAPSAAMIAAAGEPEFLAGVTYLGARRLEDGLMVQTGSGPTIVQRSAAQLPPYFESWMWSNEAESVMWTKLLANSVINPLSAIWRVPNGEVFAGPNRVAVVNKLVQEFMQVAEAKGIKLLLNSMEPTEFVRQVAVQTKTNTSSMLADVQSQRLTEIDSINGALVKYAKEVGVDVPTHEAVALLVKANTVKIRKL